MNKSEQLLEAVAIVGGFLLIAVCVYALGWAFGETAATHVLYPR